MRLTMIELLPSLQRSSPWKSSTVCLSHFSRCVCVRFHKRKKHACVFVDVIIHSLTFYGWELFDQRKGKCVFF